MTIGNKIFLYDNHNERIVTLDSKNRTQVVVSNVEVAKLFQARGQLFYSLEDAGVFRTDGTSAGTDKISGNLIVGATTSSSTRLDLLRRLAQQRHEPLSRRRQQRHADEDRRRLQPA